jgi:hypothetical protein
MLCTELHCAKLCNQMTDSAPLLDTIRDQGASRDEDTKAKISMVDLQSSTLALIQDVKNRLVDTKLHFL